MRSTILYLVLSILITALSCQNEAKKEIHFIPANYTGRVKIYFDDKTGKGSDSINKRMYIIGTSGILRTTSPPNDGFLVDNDRVFFYKKDTEQTRLPLMMIFNDSLVRKYPDSIYVFNLQTELNNGVRIFTYCVDSLKNAHRYYEETID